MKVIVESINTTDGKRYIVLNKADRFTCGNGKEFKTATGATRWAVKMGYEF
jgi:hypothetical protein